MFAFIGSVSITARGVNASDEGLGRVLMPHIQLLFCRFIRRPRVRERKNRSEQRSGRDKIEVKCYVCGGRSAVLMQAGARVPLRAPCCCRWTDETWSQEIINETFTIEPARARVIAASNGQRASTATVAGYEWSKAALKLGLTTEFLHSSDAHSEGPKFAPVAAQSRLCDQRDQRPATAQFNYLN